MRPLRQLGSHHGRAQLLHQCWSPRSSNGGVGVLTPPGWSSRHTNRGPRRREWRLPSHRPQPGSELHREFRNSDHRSFAAHGDLGAGRHHRHEPGRNVSYRLSRSIHLHSPSGSAGSAAVACRSLLRRSQAQGQEAEGCQERAAGGRMQARQGEGQKEQLGVGEDSEAETGDCSDLGFEGEHHG
jgi:hypothetical protein